MASTSAALGASGAQHEMVLNGSVVKFSLITQKTKSELERWIYQRAIKGLVDAKAIIGDQLGTALSTVTNELAVGKYSWGSPLMIETLGTISGIGKMMSLLSFDVKECRPVPEQAFADMLVSEYSAELANMFAVIFQESMPKKAEATPEEAG